MGSLVACAEALVDETVIGVDVDADWSYGAENSQFGAAVDVGESVAVAAPGAGEVIVDGSASAGASDWVGFSGESLVRGSVSGEVTLGKTTVGHVSGARTWAVDDAGILVGSSNYLVYFARTGDAASQAWALTVQGLGNVGLGEGRALAIVCGSECAGHAWDVTDGAELGLVARAGKGGAIAEIDGVVWAGDPDIEVDDGAGRVCSGAGPCIEGLRGDHLGQSIGGGYTAGTFNKWIVPARARFVPVGEGAVYAMEVGAESRPVVVAGTPETLAFGAPYYPVHGVPAGAVAMVAR